MNRQGGWYGSALQAASYGGHESIVSLSLEEGAEVNMEGGRHGSALQAASLCGAENDVPDTGAKLNARESDAIDKPLLQKSADVHKLQATSSGGYVAIIKLLLEKGALLESGANVNMRGKYGSALEGASSKGHENTVRVLLGNGANAGVHVQKALQAASSKGYHVIVTLLEAYCTPNEELHI